VQPVRFRLRSEKIAQNFEPGVELVSLIRWEVRRLTRLDERHELRAEHLEH
jgi:hypothetical protein